MAALEQPTRMDDTIPPPQNINAICHEFAHNDSQNVRRDSVRALISTLLNLEHPVVTSNMVRFLRIPDVRDVLISYVHRLPKGTDLSIASTSADGVRERSKNALATRHSYRTAQLLMYPVEEAYDNALQAEAEQIVRSLWLVFHPHSEGNFYHTRDIILLFMRKYAPETIWAIASLGPAFLQAVCYMNRAPVCEVILGILATTPEPTQVPSEVLDNFLDEFPAEEFILILAGQLLSDCPRAWAGHVRDFLVALVNELNHNPHSLAHHVFVQRQPLLEVFSSTLMERLSDASLPKPAHSSECITVLHAIVTSTTQAYSDGYPRSIEGQPITVGQIVAYSIMNEEFFAFLYGHAMRPGRVRRPKFGPIHVTIMDLMLYVSNHSPTTVLQYAPPEFMKCLVDWFFRNRHSNIFHGMFLKVFELTFYSDSSDPLRAILSDEIGSMFRRMIVDYESGPSHTCYRGHILKLCNLLVSIKTEDIGSPAVRDYVFELFETDLWNNFAQGTLKEANDLEKPRYDLKSIGHVTVPETSDWADELNTEKREADKVPPANPASPPQSIAAPSLVESPEQEAGNDDGMNVVPASPPKLSDATANALPATLAV